MSNSTPFADFSAQTVVDLLLLSFSGNQEPTVEELDQRVEQFLAGPFSALKPQKDLIVDEILQRIRVRVGAASTLDEEDGDHLEWLASADRSNWRLSSRLADYLRRVDRLPPAVLQELDRSTDQTLERLENPERPGTWDRRGMVVGHVQSGKTTHYTTLAAKALDAGYQIVIILAGIHNSLRSQTHERIDKHLIGRDSAALIEAVKNGAPYGAVGLTGVGDDDRLLGKPPLAITILTCTTSAEDGDFRNQIANQVGFQVSAGSRLVMVVKKNATILGNLTRWLRTQNSATHNKIVAPALVIDDEADNASVNTSRDPESDPTKINQLIRKLLKSFERVGFVGYTATPFANIFIGQESSHPEYGADLFPRSFIVSLQPPSDYVGPNLVFGHSGDESAGIPEQAPLPMLCPVNDSQTWLPDKHDKTCLPGPLPATLKEALKSFILVCAARACRGDIDVHNSMLVHATRFINVQGRVAEQLTDELTTLRNLIDSATAPKVQEVKQQFLQVWRSNFEERHSAFQARLGDRCPSLPSWDAVWAQLTIAVQRIEVMKVNGGSTDALAYSRRSKGIYVVAVGGNKLSRGLTLEGLSVSYFLRTSSMFDTLLQMGRWFGYRKGYVDLCRVYTTSYLYSAFQEIALAMDDLRADLARMAYAGKTPMEFGLRVRTPSDGLLITAANKIRRGEKVSVRFAGSLVQALEIERTGERAARMRMAVREFILGLGMPEREVRGKASPHLLWPKSGNAAAVLEFLGQYEAISTPSFNNYCDVLRRYIREQVEKGELTDWTIAIISKNPSPDSPPGIRIGDLNIPPVTRGKKDQDVETDRFVTGALVGLVDEAADLSDDEWLRAREASPDVRVPGGLAVNPTRDAIRHVRPPQRGLLLIYLIHDKSTVDPVEFIPAVAISFPDSQTARPLAYTVNDVWRQQFGLTEEDDADVS